MKGKTDIKKDFVTHQKFSKRFHGSSLSALKIL